MAHRRNKSRGFVNKNITFVTQKLKYCNTNVIGTLGCRKMEIKTSAEILHECAENIRNRLPKIQSSKYENKKWVRHDELNALLKGLIDMGHDPVGLEIVQKEITGE